MCIRDSFFSDQDQRCCIDRKSGDAPSRHHFRAQQSPNADIQCHMGDAACLLYTSDAADERSSVDLGGRRIIKKNKKNKKKKEKKKNNKNDE